MAGINRTTGKATDLITFSRASGGTALRKISYGSELVTNGDFSYDGDWTLTNGSITGGEYVGPASGAQGVQQTSATPLGTKLYLVQFDAYVESSVTTVYLRFGTLANSASWTIGTTPRTYTTVIAAGGVNDLIYLLAGSAVNLHLDNISVKKVTFDQPSGTLTLFNHPTNIPRIEYAADGTVKGLLIEEARTNLVTYSEALGNSGYWGQTGVTVDSNVSETTSPDGLNSAEKMVETTATSSHFIAVSLAPPSVGFYTMSIYAKAAERSIIQASPSSNWAVNPYVNFDLSSETVSASNAATGLIEKVGNGWYRCSATFYAASTSVGGMAWMIQTSPTAARGASYTGDGTSGIYVWGAQFEAGSFPTSYIPTSGATATRAADIASISVDSFGYRQDAGTVVVEARSLNVAGNGVISVVTDGTANEQMRLQAGAGNQFVVIDGGVTQAAISGGSFPSDSFAKLSTVYKANDFAVCLNGGTVGADASGSVSDATKITLGINATSNGTYLNGHIKSIAYYPRRLSNAQLQELTA